MNLLLGEISNLINRCQQDPKPSGPRDAAIFGMMYIGGLRRSEVVSIKCEDLDLPDQSLKVIGKGNKQRKVFLDSGTIDAIKDWLAHRADGNGALFLRVLKRVAK